MDAAPSPAPPHPPPEGAWPRAAQLAAALLLGGALALLGAHVWGYLRSGRPTELSAAHRIDVNRADRAELLQIPGIGPNLAERIEEYRRDHGGFRSVEELRRVRGIGPTLLARLRPWVCVEGEDELDEDTTTATVTKTPIITATKKGTGTAELIDVNSATVAELRTLPGIGPKLSQAIIDERKRAPFKSVDDLRRVHGIGAKTVDKLRSYVTVGDQPQRVAANK